MTAGIFSARKWTVASAIAAGVLFAASSAMATPTLRLTEGGADGVLGGGDDNQVTITDNVGIDSDIRAGLINISTTIGVFDINFDTAITKPQQGSPTDPQMEITYRHGSTEAGELRVEFSETGFDAGAAGPIEFLSSNSGETDDGTVQFQVFVDDSDTLFGQGAAVGDSGEEAANTNFTTNVDGTANLSGNYSLTQVLTFRNSGEGSASGDTETQIPVPATLGLFGVGLIGLGALARRRKTVA